MWLSSPVVDLLALEWLLGQKRRWALCSSSTSFVLLRFLQKELPRFSSKSCLGSFIPKFDILCRTPNALWPWIWWIGSWTLPESKKTMSEHIWTCQPLTIIKLLHSAKKISELVQRFSPLLFKKNGWWMQNNKKAAIIISVNRLTADWQIPKLLQFCTYCWTWP